MTMLLLCLYIGLKLGISIAGNKAQPNTKHSEEHRSEEEQERIESERRQLEDEQKAYREMMKYNYNTAYKMGGSLESEQR